MISTLFFDFDGVVLESVDAKTQSFAELFQDYPEHVNDIVRYHIENTGVSRFDKFRHFFTNIIKEELTDTLFQQLCNRFGELALGKVLDSPYVFGAREFFERHSKDYDCYIISATPHGEMRYITDRLKLTPYFKKVCGAPKKKGQWVAEIMSERGISCENAVFIGDSRSDHRAAVENGIGFIGRVIKERPSCFDDMDLPYLMNDFNDFPSVLNKLHLYSKGGG